MQSTRLFRALNPELSAGTLALVACLGVIGYEVYQDQAKKTAARTLADGTVAAPKRNGWD